VWILGGILVPDSSVCILACLVGFELGLQGFHPALHTNCQAGGLLSEPRTHARNFFWMVTGKLERATPWYSIMILSVRTKIDQHVLRSGALEGSIGKAHNHDNHRTKLYYNWSLLPTAVQSSMYWDLRKNLDNELESHSSYGPFTTCQSNLQVQEVSWKSSARQL
jgi:hypothetical protein